MISSALALRGKRSAGDAFDGRYMTPFGMPRPAYMLGLYLGQKSECIVVTSAFPFQVLSLISQFFAEWGFFDVMGDGAEVRAFSQEFAVAGCR
jgi:hypothetical protein